MDRQRSDQLSSTRLNLDRSIKLLDQASGRSGSQFTLNASSIMSPVSKLKRDHRLSILSISPADSPLTVADLAAMNSDATMELLGDRFAVSSHEMSVGVDTTNISELIRDGNSALDGDDLYQEFSRAYQSHKTMALVFDLLASYTKILCAKTDVTKAVLGGVSASKLRMASLHEVHECLRAEMWTWQLAESLFRDLVDSELKNAGDSVMVADITGEELLQYTSDHILMEQFFTRNDKVRRCQVVIDWLETICSTDLLDSFYNKVDFFTDKTSTMWENTLHMKKQSKPKKGIVMEMDPDAPVRTGERLAPLDIDDDERLLRYLFALIRCGKLNEAQQLCVRCGQSWRAASLEGWRLYHDPNFVESNFVEAQVETEGNLYRDVWKASCWAIAEEDTYPVYERAIYSSLCGNLQHLLPVCDSWLDSLWAHLKVLVDVEVEQHIRLHTGSDRPLADLPASFWNKNLSLAQVFKELEASEKSAIREQSLAFYHRIQKHLILLDFEGLIRVMTEMTQKPNLSPQILRFMAHFILFLRNVDKLSVDGPTVDIVERYITCLTCKNAYDLVATYCSVLPQQNQVLKYAVFLEGVRDSETRRRCLDLGHDAGLDIALITKVVVENAVSKLMDMLGEQGLSDQPGADQRAQLDDIINTLDWLTFNPEHITEALHQANAMMRVCLAMKQYDRLKQIFSKLPHDCVSQAIATSKALTGFDELLDKEANSIKEYLSFKLYLEALSAFDDWFKHFHQAPKKPQPPASTHFTDSVAHEHKVKQYEQDMQRWKYTLAATTQHTCDQLRSVLVLAGGWMVDERSGETTERRQEQMSRLRELCIPNCLFLLHKVLHETSQFSECVRLADLVASEDHCLYKVFPKVELQRFLHSITESAKQLIDQSVDSLGYPLRKL